MSQDRFYYKKSKINQIRGFCYTVQNNCSARKAALKLGLEPATITLQIRSLEEDLGIKLFDRTKNNRFVLNEKGKAFYEMAVVQLQGMESLFENFQKKVSLKNKNSLKIAVYHTALSHILPKYIKMLTKEEKFKNIEITLCNLKLKDALDRLKNKEVDFAFYPTTQVAHYPIEIKKENIFKLKNAVFLHKDHPLAKKDVIEKKDIEKYDFLLKDKYMFLDPTKIINFKQNNIKFENATSAITLGLIKENIAIGICCELYKTDNKFSNQNMVIKNVDHLLPKMYYSLFTLKNTKPKESAKFIMDKLREDSDL